MSHRPPPNGFNGTDGRNARGQFVKGNAAGKGNPIHRKMNAFRATLLASVSPDDVRAVARQLVEQAKEGEPWAIREFLDRCTGRPSQPVELTDGDGQPVGLSVQVVQTAVTEALAEAPELRARLSAKLLELAAGDSANH